MHTQQRNMGRGGDATKTTSPPAAPATKRRASGASVSLDEAPAKPTLHVLNFGGLDRDKPLICKQFTHAYAHAAKVAGPNRNSGGGGGAGAGQSTASATAQIAPHPPPTPSNGAATPVRARAAGTMVDHGLPPSIPPALQVNAACCPYFLQLTPSTKEKERHSTRSGRVLSESESLQAKHTDEYNFIIPVVGHALEQTIQEHDSIHREERELRARRNQLSPTLANGSPGAAARGGAAGEDSSSHMERDSDVDSSAGGSDSDSGLEDSDDGDVEDEDEEAAVSEMARREAKATGRRQRQLKAARSAGPAALALFYNVNGPVMPPPDFLKRIVKYSFSSPSSLVAACFYMDKLLVRHPSLLLTSENYFLLLLLATRVASKFFDTRTLNNKDFALVGGISNKELNLLEVRFLEALGCELYISPAEFFAYAADIVNAALGGTRQRRVSQLTPTPLADSEHLRILQEAAAVGPEAADTSPSHPSPPSSSTAATSARQETRVMRGSRRMSIIAPHNPNNAALNSANLVTVVGAGFAQRRARSLSLASTNSQTGAMLPFLRSASRPALPPAESVTDLHSIAHGSLAFDDGVMTAATAGGGHNAASSTSELLFAHPTARQRATAAGDDVNVDKEEEADGGQGAVPSAPGQGSTSGRAPTEPGTPLSTRHPKTRGATVPRRPVPQPPAAAASMPSSRRSSGAVVGGEGIAGNSPDNEDESGRLNRGGADIGARVSGIHSSRASAGGRVLGRPVGCSERAPPGASTRPAALASPATAGTEGPHMQPATPTLNVSNRTLRAAAAATSARGGNAAITPAARTHSASRNANSSSWRELQAVAAGLSLPAQHSAHPPLRQQQQPAGGGGLPKHVPSRSANANGKPGSAVPHLIAGGANEGVGSHYYTNAARSDDRWHTHAQENGVNRRDTAREADDDASEPVTLEKLRCIASTSTVSEANR